MTIGLVPYFEKTLLEFNPIVSVASVGSLALFHHFVGSTGLAVQHSFLSKILAYVSEWGAGFTGRGGLRPLAGVGPHHTKCRTAPAGGPLTRLPSTPPSPPLPTFQDVLWLLEDCPVQAFLPLHVAAVLMHTSYHVCSGTDLHLLSMGLGYVGLGECACTTTRTRTHPRAHTCKHTHM